MARSIGRKLLNFVRARRTMATQVFSNRVTKLFGIQYPIIQAGMVWTSGWRLASAVSNAGGLGLLGAGSMYPEVLREHIQKCKAATDKPFGVNIPLLVPKVEDYLRIIAEEKVPIVFTSAGNPKSWTGELKKRDITVVHVVSSSKFAVKAEEAGCDAVVAEGFEAGGHNGREETTTMVLVPGCSAAVKIPVIAAGGLYDARSMMAAMVLGAEGAQIGSRFVACTEASSHPDWKDTVVNAKEGDTHLMMKQLNPVRLYKNTFFQQVAEAESKCASKEELLTLLGRGRSKQGMFLGDLQNGELEIGQCSAHINDIRPAREIVESIWREFELLRQDPLRR